MGKKKSAGGHKHEEPELEEVKARAFVLKVVTHCACDGCKDKIRVAVKDITTHQGIESWDMSALESKGELRLVATADPEKLRQRLHKATRKQVDLLPFPSNNKGGAKDNKAKAAPDAAAVQALLNTLQHGGHQSVWAANPLLAGSGGLGGGWNAHGGYGGAVQAQAAYPWAAVQQQADPYAAAYYSGGGGGWGAGYPLHQGHGGGGGGAWHGHGY